MRLSSSADAQLLVAKKVVLKTSGGACLCMDKEVKVDGSQILLNSPEQAKDPPPKDPDPPTKLTLADQDGVVLAHQRFLVTLNDGGQVSGVTGEDGGAELDLPSGGKVVFPDVTMPADKTKVELLPYVVRQGDYFTRLAFAHGFDAGEVWNDPKNAEITRRPRTGSSSWSCTTKVE